MPTRKIVPRANGEGAIGDNTAGAEKYWGGGYFNVINGTDAIEMATFNNSLQWKANTIYAIGDVFFTSGLKAGQYLECTTDGTSGSAKPTIPASVVPNTTTITDNTVTWTVREISSTQIDESYSRQPSTVYQTGDIRFLYGVLPVGWFLECSTTGTSSNSDLTIATPTEGDTVTDGTVTWTLRKIGSGGGDGSAVGDIKQIAYNGTIQDGWLECDGRAVSRTMFADLFSAIGTTYGAGDGSTTFNLPDYNAAERFVQGSTVAGTVKSAGLPNITGIASIHVEGNAPTGCFYNDTSVSTKSWQGEPNIRQKSIALNASLSNPLYGASNTVQPNALTARFVIKAYDGVTPTPSEADISEMLTELTGKADRDLDNLSATGEARLAHVIVDSYYDSTTGDWWREYADGWIEQGGFISSAGYGDSHACTVNFLKPFSNTKYYFKSVMNQSTPTNANTVFWCESVSDKTTTSCKCYNIDQHNNTGINWFACGMGAQS